MHRHTLEQLWDGEARGGPLTVELRLPAGKGGVGEALVKFR